MCAIALAVWSGAADAKQRVALVIGNASYATPSWRLANPVRDAELMAERLRRLNFDVDLVRDADRRAMEGAFDRFSTRLRRAGPSGVSVVFYAGHGAEDNGVNYLIPIDATARTSEQLRYQAPPVQFLLDDMARAGNSINIVILDACRDMPLPDGSRSLGRGGLAQLDDSPNVFIAYATAPGRTAPDGAGANSPFTAALAEALAARPMDPISLLFEDVQAVVQSRSGGAQRPRFSNGLAVPRWSFGVAPIAPAVAAPAPTPIRAPVPAPAGGAAKIDQDLCRKVDTDGKAVVYCRDASGSWFPSFPAAAAPKQNEDVIVVTGSRSKRGSRP